MKKIDLSNKLDVLLLIMLSAAVIIIFAPFWDILGRIGLAFVAVYLLLKAFDRWHKPPNGNTLEANNSAQ